MQWPRFSYHVVTFASICNAGGEMGACATLNAGCTKDALNEVKMFRLVAQELRTLLNGDLW